MNTFNKTEHIFKRGENYLLQYHVIRNNTFHRRRNDIISHISYEIMSRVRIIYYLCTYLIELI